MPVSLADLVVTVGSDIGGALAGLASVSGAIGKMSADFETSMNKVANNTGMTDAELLKMKASVIALGKEGGAAFDDLGQGFMHIENFGFRGAQATNILREAMKSAVATGTDVNSTANVLAGTMKNFGVRAQDASKAMNALHQAGVLGNMTLKEFNSVAGTALSTGAEYKQGIAEVSAAISAMTQHQMKASEAATQYTGIIKGIIHPSKQASDTLAELSKVSGVDLVHDFSVTGLETKKLSGIMEDLNKATHGHAELILNKLMPAQRGGRGLLLLLQLAHRDFIKDLASENDMIAGKLDPTTQGFNRTLQTFQNQVNQTWNEIKADFLPVGDALLKQFREMLPDLRDLAKALADALGWFTRLPSPVKDFALAIGGVTLAVRGLNAAIGIFTGVRVGQMLTGFGAIRSGAAGLSLGIPGIAAALAGAAGYAGIKQWERNSDQEIADKNVTGRSDLVRAIQRTRRIASGAGEGYDSAGQLYLKEDSRPNDRDMMLITSAARKIGVHLSSAADMIGLSAVTLNKIAGVMHGELLAIPASGRWQDRVKALASGMGLSAISEFRAGAVTRGFGTPSLHATGEAIDFRGTKQQMAAFFQEIRRDFPGQIRQLLYSPLGQVTNNRFDPTIHNAITRSDHYDHVHVALGRAAAAAASGAGSQGAGPSAADDYMKMLMGMGAAGSKPKKPRAVGVGVDQGSKFVDLMGRLDLGISNIQHDIAAKAQSGIDKTIFFDVRQHMLDVAKGITSDADAAFKDQSAADRVAKKAERQEDNAVARAVRRNMLEMVRQMKEDAKAAAEEAKKAAAADEKARHDAAIASLRKTTGIAEFHQQIADISTGDADGKLRTRITHRLFGAQSPYSGLDKESKAIVDGILKQFDAANTKAKQLAFWTNLRKEGDQAMRGVAETFFESLLSGKGGSLKNLFASLKSLAIQGLSKSIVEELSLGFKDLFGSIFGGSKGEGADKGIKDQAGKAAGGIGTFASIMHVGASQVGIAVAELISALSGAGGGGKKKRKGFFGTLLDVGLGFLGGGPVGAGAALAGDLIGGEAGALIGTLPSIIGAFPRGAGGTPPIIHNSTGPVQVSSRLAYAGAGGVASGGTPPINLTVHHTHNGDINSQIDNDRSYERLGQQLQRDLRSLGLK